MAHEDKIRQRIDTFTFSDFSAAALFKVVSMFTLPSARCEIVGQFYQVTTLFAGTGMTSITASTGTSGGSYIDYLAAQSVRTTGVKTLKGSEPNLRFLVPLSGGPLYIRLEADQNLTNLTQGSLTVYTCYIYHDY